jgi:hypothetical protein
MIIERIIQAINNGIREHYGLAPKYIAMNRKTFEDMEIEYTKGMLEHNSQIQDTIGIEKHLFFGIPIRIKEIEKEFELYYHVDPVKNIEDEVEKRR